METPSQVKLCGAKTQKGKGPPCKKAGLRNGRCKWHGGETPRGPAHGAYKHGRYSKFLAGSALSRYSEALSNESRLSFIDDIALVESQVMETLEEMPTEGGGLPELWGKMNSIRLRAQAGKLTKANAVMQIMQIVEQGADTARKWERVFTLQVHKKNLIEAENRGNSLAERSVSVEEMMFLINQFIEIVNASTNDRQTLAKITKGVEATILANTTGRA